MSKIRNGKTEDGKAQWFQFRKPKFRRKSKLRQTMWIAKIMANISSAKLIIEEKRKKGTLITKRFEYGDQK